MTINANVQFDSFVDFAQKSMEAGSSKAVARADAVVPGTDGGYATRTIVAAPDKAFKLSRSITDKAKNDLARTLFQKSVIDMFGGEDKIPKSVKEAMLLKDYGEGKPLTARRIIAVKRAIDSALVLDAVTSGLPHVNDMNEAAKRPRIDLSKKQLSTAMKLVEKHGKGLPEKGVRLLANFTMTLIACDKTARLDWDACVEKYAQDVSKWKDFKPGDPRYSAVDAKLTEHSRSSLDEYLSASQDSEFDGEGRFNVFILDASRNDFVINGQAFPRDTDAVVGAFTNALTSAPLKHRKALSAFFCQMPTSNLVGLSQTNSLPPTAGLPQGIDLKGLKGTEMIISGACGFDDKFYRVPKTEVSKSRFNLDVAPDGKSAKISIEMKGNLIFAMDALSNAINNRVGTFAWKEEFVFDLSGDQPKIASARIGQTFDA